MTADRFVAQFAGEGWVRSVEVTGNVQGSRKVEGEGDGFSADAATMELWPKVSQPKELNLTGNVNLQAQFSRTGEARKLQTTALRIVFGGG